MYCWAVLASSANHILGTIPTEAAGDRGQARIANHMLVITAKVLQSMQERMLRQKARTGKENAAKQGNAQPKATEEEESSPFAAISASMGWETFHMVQVLPNLKVTSMVSLIVCLPHMSGQVETTT